MYWVNGTRVCVGTATTPPFWHRRPVTRYGRPSRSFLGITGYEHGDHYTLKEKLNWKWFRDRMARVPILLKIMGVTGAALLVSGVSFLLVLWVGFPTLMLVRIESLALNEWRVQLLVVLLLAVLAVFVVAYSLSWLLTRPIQSMVVITRQAAQGDFSQRIPVWSNDEIGELAEAYNAMMDSLSQSQAALESANRHLQTQNEALSLLFDLAGLAVQPMTIEQMLNSSLSRIVKTMAAEGGFIALIDPAKQRLVVRATNHCAAVSKSLPVHLAGSEELLQPFEIYLASASANGLGAGLASICRQHGYQTVLGAPIRDRDTELGILCVFDAREHTGLEEGALLSTAGNQLGSALDRSQLLEELRQKETVRTRLLAKVVSAQEKERERISRELHDETGQALTALLVQLRVLEESSASETFAGQVETMRDIVSQTLQEVRRLARDLRPATLDDLGLAPTLESYVKEYARNTGINVQYDANNLGPKRLPFQTEVVFYRVAQEALTNVARHACANSVFLHLSRINDMIRLRVRDDGCGFDVDRALMVEENSLGLSGMKERIELIGGEFQLVSRPGHGTDLRVQVKIPE